MTKFAFTEPKGTMPGYINVSESSKKGDLIIKVRSPRASVPSQITLPKAEVAKFISSLQPDEKKDEQK
jgi:hypothetical protein